MHVLECSYFVLLIGINISILNRLIELRITNQLINIESSISAIVNNCHNLEIFDYEASVFSSVENSLSWESLLEVIKSNPNLTTIHIQNLSNLSDDSPINYITHIVSICPNLLNLTVITNKFFVFEKVNQLNFDARDLHFESKVVCDDEIFPYKHYINVISNKENTKTLQVNTTKSKKICLFAHKLLNQSYNNHSVVFHSDCSLLDVHSFHQIANKNYNTLTSLTITNPGSWVSIGDYCKIFLDCKMLTSFTLKQKHVMFEVIKCDF